jgi:hypothetical protein
MVRFQYIFTVQPHFLNGNFGSKISVQSLARKRQLSVRIHRSQEFPERQLRVGSSRLTVPNISAWCSSGFDR